MSPGKVSCPTCGAKPDKPCTTTDNGTVLHYFHRSRYTYAELGKETK